MIGIGTGKVFENKAFVTYQLFKTGSAQKHSTSDDTTLRTELIKALNLDEAKKEKQGGGVFRVKINDGKGYLVYKTPLNEVPKTAAIFHYHWNYHLDLPLSAT